jgi:hypothetical protein
MKKYFYSANGEKIIENINNTKYTNNNAKYLANGKTIENMNNIKYAKNVNSIKNIRYNANGTIEKMSSMDWDGNLKVKNTLKVKKLIIGGQPVVIGNSGNSDDSRNSDDSDNSRNSGEPELNLVEVGEPCNSNNMCKSGNCSNDSLLIGESIGVCKRNDRPDGNKCSVNKDCLNKKCGRASGADADNNNYVCCRNGKSITHGVVDFCADLQLGEQCVRNTQCASGICTTHSVQGGIGYCTDGKPGSKCANINGEGDNDNCMNKQCGRVSFAKSDEKNFICCTDGINRNRASKDYCKVGQNKICNGNDYCISGDCDNSIFFPEGKCK